MSQDYLSSMIPFFGCVMQSTPEGLRFTGAGPGSMNAAALTCQIFRPSFRLTAVAKTDSTNLRLYWHAGEIIFNWECSEDELRVHHPATGEQFGIEGRGSIAVDEWHEIVWEVDPGSMRVLVNGQLRFECGGEFADIQAPLAIGPCFGSTVTIRAFSVEAM